VEKETYKSRSFHQVVAELDNNIVIVFEDLCDLASDPSASRAVSFILPVLEIGRAYFFITSTLTFCMSTF
jgi:hypothetical protein